MMSDSGHDTKQHLGIWRTVAFTGAQPLAQLKKILCSQPAPAWLQALLASGSCWPSPLVPAFQILKYQSKAKCKQRATIPSPPYLAWVTLPPLQGTREHLLCCPEFCRPTPLRSIWADSATETFAAPSAFPAWCVCFHRVLQAICVAIWWNIYLECLICILITP